MKRKRIITKRERRPASPVVQIVRNSILTKEELEKASEVLQKAFPEKTQPFFVVPLNRFNRDATEEEIMNKQEFPSNEYWLRNPAPEYFFNGGQLFEVTKRENGRVYGTNPIPNGTILCVGACNSPEHILTFVKKDCPVAKVFSIMVKRRRKVFELYQRNEATLLCFEIDIAITLLDRALREMYYYPTIKNNENETVKTKKTW